jgi:hypothetical protein
MRVVALQQDNSKAQHDVDSGMLLSWVQLSEQQHLHLRYTT